MAQDPSRMVAAPLSGAELARNVTDLFHELLEGMPGGQPTWITSGGPDGGAYGTIAALDAAQASMALGGTSVAAHVEHLRWALQLFNAFFEGQPPPANWADSWLVSTVTEGEWDQLQDDLRATATEALGYLSNRSWWDDAGFMRGVLAAYGHTAYHLGALRQLRKQLHMADRAVREGSPRQEQPDLDQLK